MIYVKKLTTQILVLIVFASISVVPAWSGATRMGVSEAHELAMRGAVVLIDVRSPGEWEETGIGASAQAVSMHLPGFFKKVNAIVRGDKSRPIALICATGARSGRMQTMLRKRGYKNIISVAEGMFGNASGPGWLNSGLPVKTPN